MSIGSLGSTKSSVETRVVERLHTNADRGRQTVDAATEDLDDTQFAAVVCTLLESAEPHRRHRPRAQRHPARDLDPPGRRQPPLASSVGLR